MTIITCPAWVRWASGANWAQTRWNELGKASIARWLAAVRSRWRPASRTAIREDSGNHRPSGFFAADYCAYPVASAESDAIRASIGVGLRDPEGSQLVRKNYL